MLQHAYHYSADINNCIGVGVLIFILIYANIYLYMSEKNIKKIDKSDIQPPQIQPGGTAIVFQRHEKYQRDVAADNAGSIFREDADTVKAEYERFFEDVIANEGEQEATVLFVSSDTQYNGKGHRSLETAQLAQDAAKVVFEKHNLDPSDRIINLSSDFNVSGFLKTRQLIRPFPKLREPQIFDHPEYADHLRDKYGGVEGLEKGLSPAAWSAHEADSEQVVRERIGAEGIYDILKRTKRSIEILERYARAFHKSNPNKKLIIWVASHYDTISPFVKDTAGISITEEYLPVEYGGGVIIDIPPEETNPTLKIQGQTIPIKLGRSSLKSDPDSRYQK